MGHIIKDVFWKINLGICVSSRSYLLAQLMKKFREIKLMTVSIKLYCGGFIKRSGTH